MLPLKGAWVRSLVGEVLHASQSDQKKKKSILVKQNLHPLKNCFIKVVHVHRLKSQMVLKDILKNTSPLPFPQPHPILGFLLLYISLCIYPCFFCFLFFVFCFFAMPRSLQDLSSLTRDQIQAMAVKVQNPDHKATRELPYPCISNGHCFTPLSRFSLCIHPLTSHSGG